MASEPLICCMCLGKALRKVGRNGYCAVHIPQANEAARRESLHASISYAESHSAIEQAVKISDRRARNGLRA